MYESIEENLKSVRGRIADAAGKAGRDQDEITLVAVSKTHPAEAIRAAVEYGVTCLGEAQIREAEPKIEQLGRLARWHMIGHLQTNKVKKAVALFDLIESVDSWRLAAEIDRRAAQAGRKIDCLLEVNISGEPSKTGIDPEETTDLVAKMSVFDHLNLIGLMTIGPLTEDMKQIRGAFRRTKELFEHCRRQAGTNFRVLSMGMSDDFEIAIEEGATMVRIGTAIFGRRPG
nr:YggS family pyridoxal phosphate-dependent enzyme [candidate division Zixibacteria bacterium]